MSWEAYMTSLEGYTNNKMHYGAIYGLDGNCWTSKGPLTVTKDEALSLTKICDNIDVETTKAQSGGIFLDSKKFRFLRSDSDEKSVTFVRSEGEKLHNGFAIKTKMAVIICVCEEEGKSSTATSGTCKLAEYLVSLGY
ncbi:profilin-1-like [Haliotis cracherodii]|uniref:profilin-1-like n=1 Tax=Haliotis cracherodii TaxID=6455 RepID=UPI0039EBB8A6